MEFFQSQESLTAIHWILRAVVSFFFLIVFAKLMGQRPISQSRFLDFALALLIGNIIAHPLSDERLGMKGSLITTAVLITLYLIAIYLSLKFLPVRKIFHPEPLVLIDNGKIKYKSLKRARISIDYLLSELRKQKVDDITKVAYAYWEAGGSVSIFLYPKYLPITHSSKNQPIQPFIFPATVIKQGKIDNNELQRIGKNETWLESQLTTNYNVFPKDVLLATVLDGDNLKVFLYK